MFNILDTITTKDKVYKGIIDYETTKHIIVYDLTMNEDPEVILFVLNWKVYYNCRFSVYCSLYQNDFRLPPPIQIYKSDIETINAPNQPRMDC